MSIDFGRFGVWRRVAEITPELAADAERLGYGAVWVGGSPTGDLDSVERLLEATERIPMATGIVNMWREGAEIVAASYHRIQDRHPDRFILGLGIGHPESSREYAKPYQSMVDYLDRVEAAGVPADRLLLAALGPRVLTLSAERTVGAHPYLTTPRHTRLAREVMGEGPLLAPEQKVILDTDIERARAVGRENVARYLRLVNYRNNLLREGWAETDLADGGSDTLVDALILYGEVPKVAEGIKAHLEAGADHVCIQVLGGDPIEGQRRLAEVLLG
jgi:probable F420-dependent oxidoreductase